MLDFDPDEYLATKSQPTTSGGGFDPDTYLAGSKPVRMDFRNMATPDTPEYLKKPSMIQSMFAKYAPDVPQFGFDFAGGVSDLPRKALNYAKPGLGEQAFPSHYADKDSYAYMGGQFFDPLSMAVGGAATKLATKAIPMAIPAVTQGMPAAKEALGRVVARSALGAGTAGATTAALSGADLEDIATAGGYTALFGAGAPLITQALAKGSGWAVDAVKGKLAQIKAAKIARAAAGENLPAVRQALAAAAPGETAAQATAAVRQPTFAALGDTAAKVDRTDYYTNLAKQQVADREGMLTGVTPDVPAAEAARLATMRQMTDAAEQAGGTIRSAREATMMPPAPAQGNNPFRGVGGAPERMPGATPDFPAAPALETLKGNPVINVLMAEARRKASARTNLPEDIARMSKEELADIIKDPTKSLAGLRLMKAAIDERFKDPNSTSVLTKLNDAEAASIKQALMGASETAFPGWGAARSKFAEMSAPVNQGNVLNEITSVLKKPTETGERVVPFLNALGRGEDAALTRAGLNTRFGGLEDVLAPDQFSAVTKVKDQLVRDADLKDLAAKGQPALNDIVDSFASSFKLPGFMSGKITAANKALELVNRNLSENTKKALAEGMRNGKSAQELLDVLPTAERNKFLMILSTSGADTASYMGAQVGARQ